MKQILHISLILLLLALNQCKSKQNFITNDVKIIKGIVGENIVGDGNRILVPMPGVSIICKRQKKHLETDTDGKFEIEVKKGDTLFFSYTSFESKQIIIKSKNYYKVVLKEKKGI